MTKEQRLKAMGTVIHACGTIKDKKPLAEAIRTIVGELQAAEKAHKVAARAAENANREKRKGIVITKERRFAPDVGHAIQRLSDAEFARIEQGLRTLIPSHPKE